MTKLTNVQRAFLAGVRLGCRLGRKRAARDIGGIVDELRDMHDAVRADLARSIDDEPEPETPN